MPYDNAAVIYSKEPQSDGRVLIRLRFSGTGEQSAEREYFIDSNSTLETVKDYIAKTVAQLNQVTVAKKLPEIAQGQVIIGALKTTPQADMDKQAWRKKVTKLQTLAQLGVVGGTLATDIATLKSEVASEYKAGYLDAL